jgi:hypothetical protein
MASPRGEPGAEAPGSTCENVADAAPKRRVPN